MKWNYYNVFKHRNKIKEIMENFYNKPIQIKKGKLHNVYRFITFYINEELPEFEFTSHEQFDFHGFSVGGFYTLCSSSKINKEKDLNKIKEIFIRTEKIKKIKNVIYQRRSN